MDYYLSADLQARTFRMESGVGNNLISAGLLFIYRPRSKDFEQNVELGVIGLNKLECDLFIKALTTIPYIYHSFLR